jgi:hypothetical protein
MNDQFNIIDAEVRSIRAASDAVDSTLDLATATTERNRNQTLVLNHSNGNLQTMIAKMP